MKQVQHYVPQFLLRRFAIERRRKHRPTYQIWARDLKEDRTFLTSVQKVAAEAGFYRLRSGGPDADWLEQRLSEIEDVAAPAVGRLIESNWETHTEEDRVTLAILLISLYSRSPRVRRNLEALPGMVLEHLRQGGGMLGPELEAELKATQEQDPVPDHAGVILDTARNYPALLGRSWWLLVPPAESRFICSDCAVLITNPLPERWPVSNMGLLCEGIILYLPLSPYLMLMVADSVHGLPDKGVLHLGSEEFRNLQGLTAFHTERFIYGRAPEDLLVPPGSWVGGRRPEIVKAFPRRVSQSPTSGA